MDSITGDNWSRNMHLYLLLRFIHGEIIHHIVYVWKQSFKYDIHQLSGP